MLEKLNNLLSWFGVIPDHEEEEKDMIMAEKLEIEHQEMIKEDKRKRNEDWVNHINYFYWVIKERKLETIARKYYREWHLKWNTNFIRLQKEINEKI